MGKPHDHFRQLKGLEDIISMSVVHPFMGNKGWTFAEGTGVIVDPIIHASYLYEVYIAAKPNYTGRVTIPILWDKRPIPSSAMNPLRLFVCLTQLLMALGQ